MEPHPSRSWGRKAGGWRLSQLGRASELHYRTVRSLWLPTTQGKSPSKQLLSDFKYVRISHSECIPLKLGFSIRNANSRAPPQTYWNRNCGGGARWSVLTGPTGDWQFSKLEEHSSQTAPRHKCFPEREAQCPALGPWHLQECNEADTRPRYTESGREGAQLAVGRWVGDGRSPAGCGQVSGK